MQELRLMTWLPTRRQEETLKRLICGYAAGRRNVAVHSPKLPQLALSTASTPELE
jgi:hypothetical protein